MRMIAARFTNHRLDLKKLPKLSKDCDKRLFGLANLTALLRTTISRKSGELIHPPRTEVPTRLIKQYKKMAVCLATVYGDKEVKRSAMRIVERMATDTCIYWHYQLANRLLTTTKPVSIRTLSTKIGFPPHSVGRRLLDLRELGAVDAVGDEVVEDEYRSIGRPPKYWRPSARMTKFWNMAKIGKT